MPKRFRIALSFAGEKRAFVSEVARLLAECFGKEKILYDQYHEAEFAVYDLGLRLPKLYGEESDLVVPVLCPNYDVKRWTGWEWVYIYGLLTKDDGRRVMPSRFNYASVDGLGHAAAFIELDEKTPDQFVALILERLAINEGRPRDYYSRVPGAAPAGPDWPEHAPALAWSIADHREAQRAFAALITRQSPHRLLCIYGASDTGKSHLTKQFLRNAPKVAGIRYCRFDLKGSSDMSAEMQTFASRLGAPEPAAELGLAQKFGQVLAHLEKHVQPTLLIFDTFERAGGLERWVKESLLFSLGRAPWLRVIIVGQQVVRKYGEPWEEISADPVQLHPPTPQEWCEYGRVHQPSITLPQVEFVHALAKGRSSLLAQLFGPAA